jgi:AGCS family alanine or glycine:cation symporter
MGFLNSMFDLEDFANIDSFAAFVSWLDNVVWGPLMLILIVGTGLFLTVRLKFRPWRNLGYALKSIFAKRDDTKTGDISPFQSLMTALSATVGVGNIAGVATAIAAGGPGALLWMWLTAVVGLSTKYAESLIAVKFRTVNDKGEMAGGAMFALRDGLKNKTLGKVLGFFFALFAVVASFGIGNMTQSNTVASAMNNAFNVPAWVTGAVLVGLCLIVILGGIKKIGAVSGKIVPFMAALYFIVALVFILVNIKELPSGLYNILVGAFSPQSIMGGVLGNIIATAIQKGVARGVFSNEAGLGSAPIAAAAAKTDHPARQGYINMTGTFIDTIIICTLTGFVIACSGVLFDPATGAYTTLTGAELTSAAFGASFGTFGHMFIAIAVFFFAFSTILGWSYYGEKCLEYLAGGTKLNVAYRLIFSLLPIVGAMASLDLVWNISDVFNALMAIPNLIALLLLSNLIAKETEEFQLNYIIPETKAAKERKMAK